MLISDRAERSASYRFGGFTLFLAAAVILTALGFQYLGGLAPCPLCLMQRYAYYAAIPLLFIAMALVSELPRLAAVLFAIVALAFLANAGLGIYHAGVEWKFWAGPETCGTLQGLASNPADLLKGLETTHVPRCDEAAWTFLGLSMAGWNAVVSLAAFLGALKAATLAAAGAE